MIVSSVFFALGSIEQAASQVLRELVLGRALVGVGVGMSSMVVPTFLAECAPADVRGRMVGANSLLVTGGQVLAYAIAALFYTLPHSWRWMVLLGAVPALAQLAGLWTLDESPRWLSAHGRHVQARAGVVKLYPTASSEAVDAYLRGFERGHEERVDKRGALKELFQSSNGRRALALACGLQAAQQLCGANSM
jgi:SP family myo-inositol transporter-like MFS transporter 13